MQNVVEVPCASMRVRFLVCARVWESARAHAYARVRAHNPCVCLCLRLCERASLRGRE